MLWESSKEAADTSKMQCQHLLICRKLILLCSKFTMATTSLTWLWTRTTSSDCQLSWCCTSRHVRSRHRLWGCGTRRDCPISLMSTIWLCNLEAEGMASFLREAGPCLASWSHILPNSSVLGQGLDTWSPAFAVDCAAGTIFFVLRVAGSPAASLSYFSQWAWCRRGVCGGSWWRSSHRERSHSKPRWHSSSLGGASCCQKSPLHGGPGCLVGQHHWTATAAIRTKHLQPITVGTLWSRTEKHLGRRQALQGGQQRSTPSHSAAASAATEHHRRWLCASAYTAITSQWPAVIVLEVRTHGAQASAKEGLWTRHQCDEHDEVVIDLLGLPPKESQSLWHWGCRILQRHGANVGWETFEKCCIGSTAEDPGFECILSATA